MESLFYTRTLLQYLAKRFDLKLHYLGANQSQGYVSDGKSLRVFSKGSSVDVDNRIKII